MATFCDHIVVQKNPEDYTEMVLTPSQIFDAWKSSMFSHELIAKDGTIMGENTLKGASLQKYISAYEALKRDEAVEKPVLGIGLFDGIEIGIGREIIAAAYHLNISDLPIHVRTAQAEEIMALFKVD